MKHYVQRFKENKEGHDYCLGDIHGHFRKLEQELIAIGFDENKDRLFTVGDLVDRHDDSGLFEVWLKKPWFFSVRGNHEEMLTDAVEYGECTPRARLHYENGGNWLYLHEPHVRKYFSDILKELPLAIEVETKHGLIGIIHAEVPYNDWDRMKELMNDPVEGEHTVAHALWSRKRLSAQDKSLVKNIHHVYVGHSPVKDVTTLGNTTYCDLGGWFKGGRFELLQIN